MTYKFIFKNKLSIKEKHLCQNILHIIFCDAISVKKFILELPEAPTYAASYEYDVSNYHN